MICGCVFTSVCIFTWLCVPGVCWGGGGQKTMTNVSHDCSLPCPLRQDLSFNLDFSDLVKLAPEIFLHLCISDQSWGDRQHVWSYDIYVGAEDSNLGSYACAVVTLSTGTSPSAQYLNAGTLCLLKYSVFQLLPNIGSYHQFGYLQNLTENRTRSTAM